VAVNEISVDDLADGVPVLIDVREVDEYMNGHIPGAINVPLSEIAERVVDCTLGDVVHVVCASGGRSQRACEFLHSRPEGAGRTFVNVLGGTNAWVLKGFEVVTGDRPR
jgi:rhodanese-related sulfurtransferase